MPYCQLLRCRDTPIVDGEALDGYLKMLPSWQVNDAKTVITRTFVAKNFVAAIDFFNKVKVVAEEQGHHPDLHLTNYRYASANLHWN